MKFDDYISDWFHINNGIVQGDLLSMVLYLFYNADMLDVAYGRDELVLGYVDEVALLAAAKTTDLAYWALSDMVIHPGGALDWSAQHNSMFEASKSVFIDFSWSKPSLAH